MSDFATELQALRLLKQLVSGMTLLWNHPQRIVHRDLKPDNIIIRPNGTAAIIDLGIVREQGAPGVTSTLQHFGPCTPAYASPEQLRNQKRAIDFRADFFSLGVIVYELVAGQNPFAKAKNEPVEYIIERTLTSTPITLVERGLAGHRLSALVDALMAKEPYKRPRTIQILANEIDQIIEAG